MSLLLTFMLYPGLLTALALAAAFELLTSGRTGLPSALSQLGAGLGEREGLLALAGTLLAGLALALLPWPLRPAGAGQGWIWAWLALELAFLLPLLPAMLGGDPPVARAAIREIQTGVVARALLWPALVVGMTLSQQWAGWALAAHGLILLAGVLALPAAIGWGPFGGEASITPGGPEQGLSPAALGLATLARSARSAALIAALLIASLPLALAPAWLAPLMIVAGFVVAGALLRRIAGRWPRLTLRDALRFCWMRILPLSAASIVCLIVWGR